jgi:4-hydroxybenzoate polyprenyltransferase
VSDPLKAENLDSTTDLKNTKSNALSAWAKLVRFPAVFTVVAQVLAGYFVMFGDEQAIIRLTLAVFAGISLYWSGMILNDLWDLEEDTRERPGRPLPAGLITVSVARKAAWGFMVAGNVLAAFSGFVPATGLSQTYCPAIIGAAISVCVLFYNGMLKSTLLAPVTMGLCRTLCFLLGAAPLVMVNDLNLIAPDTWFDPHVLGFALGMGVYITGITLISKSETEGGLRFPIAMGTIVVIVGAACIALAPGFAPQGIRWQVTMAKNYYLLVGLVAFTIVFRGIRATMRPEPVTIQNLVRAGVLTLIPLSAIVALLPAGPGAAMLIFALVIPAVLSAAWIRVT